MTVPVDDRRKEYPGNGVAIVFAGPRATSAAHLAVSLVDQATQVATPVSVNDYDLTGLGGRGATSFTMHTPPPTGQTLLILRTVPYSQDADISNQGAYLPETVENSGLDPLAMQVQQLDDRISRAIRFPDEMVGDIDTALPAMQGNRYVVTNVDGTGLAFADDPPTADLTLRADLANPAKGADMVAVKDTAGNFAGADVEAILAELSNRFEVNAERFGAVGDGVADDSVAIDLAILAAAGGVLRLRPGKTYRLGTHLYGLSTGLRMGSNTTIIAYGATILRGTSDISVMLSNDSDGTIGGYGANSNLRIYGGTWDTNFAVLGTPSIPIGFCHSQGIVIRDAVFPNAAGSHHVEINSSSRVVIEGCAFIGGAEQADDTMEALQIDGAISSATWGTGPFDNTFCSNVRVHNNTFAGTGCGVGTHSSVSGFYHDNISVIGNLFSGAYFAGVRALNWQMSIIANNRFFGGFHAIRAQAKDTTVVRGLTITSNVMWNIGDTAYGAAGDGHGIYLLGSDTTTECIKDYTIANNSIYGMNKPKSGSGIKVTTCSVGTVTGNVVEITASGIGIDMFGGGSCVVANNRASNEGAGFKSMSFVSMTAIVVTGNLFNTGYVQGSDRVILRQNQCFTTSGITTGAGNTNTTISENLQNTTFA